MFRYAPTKKMAKYEYSLIGFTAFVVGAVFSFFPMAFDSSMWWIPLTMMSLGLMIVGAISILIGGLREAK